jgi:hypothetical protein
MKENNTATGKRTPRTEGEQHCERKANATKARGTTPQNENNLTNGGKILKFEASNEKQTLLLLLLLLLTILMTMICVPGFTATVVQMKVGRFGEFPPVPPCGNGLSLVLRKNIVPPSSR